MPPKKHGKKKSKVAHVAPTKGHHSSVAQSAISIVDAVGTANDKKCAYQLLNADASIDTNDLVDAPVGDSSPVHMFCTQTSLTVSSVNRTDGTVAYTYIAVRPCPQYHITYGTAYGNDGSRTTGVDNNVEDYASLAGVYDDIRCCALMVVTKDASIEEKVNGTFKVLNVNPAGTTMTAALVDTFPGLEYPPNKLHYSRTPWVPARPEVDHAFISPTATPNSESTMVVIYGTHSPIASGPMLTRVHVYAIWAGRLLPATDFVASPKMFAITPSAVEKHLQAMLLPEPYGKPLWSQARIMCKDDGAIGSIISDASRGWGGVKKIFSSDSSWKDRIKGGLDLVSSIGNIGSVIGGLFSFEDRVVSRLAGLTDEELQYMQKLLAPGLNPNQSPCPTTEMVAELVERRRYLRRRGHIRKSYHSFTHTSKFEDEVAVNHFEVGVRDIVYKNWLVDEARVRSEELLERHEVRSVASGFSVIERYGGLGAQGGAAVSNVAETLKGKRFT